MVGSDLDGADLSKAKGLKKNQLRHSFYRKNLPKIPEKINPPVQYDEWRKKHPEDKYSPI